jgi:nucleotide-binding universal stress UspA family protein
MSQQSILLSLDGSIYSRYAANLCWHIANATGASVTAQHVIDDASTHDFIVHEPAGFISQAQYFAAYELVRKEQHELATKLKHAYVTEAAKHGIKTEFVVDHGEPALAISERALCHDLVVVGHRPFKSKDGSAHRRQIARHFTNVSVAEALAHECPTPLLIVQDDAPLMPEMTILLSLEHLNERYIDTCLALAKLLGQKTNILCLATGGHEEPPTQLVNELREVNANIKDTPIEVISLADVSTLNGEQIPGHCALRADATNMSSTLPVLPTRLLGQSRVTILGGSPSLFVRYLALSSILLLPEEHLVNPDSPKVPHKEEATNLS